MAKWQVNTDTGWVDFSPEISAKLEAAGPHDGDALTTVAPLLRCR